MHDLGRELITLERGADLVRDSFDERYLVVLKSLSGFTPNQAKQSKCLATNPNRCDERSAASEDGVEQHSKWKRQVRLKQTQRLALGHDFNHRRKRRDIERLPMLIEKSLNLFDGSVRCGFERCQVDSISVSIQHSKRG